MINSMNELREIILSLIPETHFELSQAHTQFKLGRLQICYRLIIVLDHGAESFDANNPEVLVDRLKMYLEGRKNSGDQRSI